MKSQKNPPKDFILSIYFFNEPIVSKFSFCHLRDFLLGLFYLEIDYIVIIR
jgi:hypothetical protein